jgi:hypothetical protein
MWRNTKSPFSLHRDVQRFQRGWLISAFTKSLSFVREMQTGPDRSNFSGDALYFTIAITSLASPPPVSSTAFKG